MRVQDAVAKALFTPGTTTAEIIDWISDCGEKIINSKESVFTNRFLYSSQHVIITFMSEHRHAYQCRITAKAGMEF